MIGLILAGILLLLSGILGATWEGAFLLSMKFLFVWYCFSIAFQVFYIWLMSKASESLSQILKNNLPVETKESIQKQLMELEKSILRFRQITQILARLFLLFGVYLLFTSGKAGMSFAEFNFTHLQLGALLVVSGLLIIYQKKLFSKKTRLDDHP